MRRHHKLVLGLATVALATTVYVAHGHRVAPANVYPPNQGLIATSDVRELTQVASCGTYSKCHRQTTGNMKTAVCNDMPVNCKGTHEIDHIVPLALGGADDVKNLWAEPEHIMVNGEDLGFHTKDRLETLLVSMMKQGQITPKDAQNCIQSDWVKCYHQYVKTSFGSISVIEDLDGDSIVN